MSENDEKTIEGYVFTNEQRDVRRVMDSVDVGLGHTSC
jgi:hypothetical protein